MTQPTGGAVRPAGGVPPWPYDADPDAHPGAGPGGEPSPPGGPVSRRGPSLAAVLLVVGTAVVVGVVVAVAPPGPGGAAVLGPPALLGAAVSAVAESRRLRRTAEVMAVAAAVLGGAGALRLGGAADGALAAAAPLAALAALCAAVRGLRPATAAWPLAAWVLAQGAVLVALDRAAESDLVRAAAEIGVAVTGLALALLGRRSVSLGGLAGAAPWWVVGVLGGLVGAWRAGAPAGWGPAVLVVLAAAALLATRWRPDLAPLLGPSAVLPVLAGATAGLGVAGPLAGSGPGGALVAGCVGLGVGTAAALAAAWWSSPDDQPVLEAADDAADGTAADAAADETAGDTGERAGGDTTPDPAPAGRLLRRPTEPELAALTLPVGVTAAAALLAVAGVRLSADARWAQLAVLAACAAAPALLLAGLRPGRRPVALPVAVGALTLALVLWLVGGQLTVRGAAGGLTALVVVTLAALVRSPAGPATVPTGGAGAVAGALAVVLTAVSGDRPALATVLAVQGLALTGWSARAERAAIAAGAADGTEDSPQDGAGEVDESIGTVDGGGGTGDGPAPLPVGAPAPRRPLDPDELADAAARGRRAGAGELVVAAWTVVALTGHGSLEGYTLPLAAGLLLASGGRLLRAPSWRAWGPGLLVAAVPSAVLAVGTPGVARPLVVAGLATVAVVAGARWRLRAPVEIGAGTLVALVLGLLAVALPWPVVAGLAAAGLALIVAGGRRERRTGRGLLRLADLH